ncbi:DUF5683 domain-containing protein [Flavobacterium sp.]|uniref:DUF5683 domain-containing protein n=1 Tax=Flavobacterium sp. TaxID=239 RepID=UPI0039E56613
MIKQLAIFFAFLFFANTISAQSGGELTVVQDSTEVKPRNEDINPLSPAKAAFYSAVFPGLGQAYNKKYWKMPLVYGAIGAGVYFYTWNNQKYHEFRDVYKRRLAGYTDDKYPFLDNERLISAQRFYQKNRDISALVTAAFYILNIIDANVDAHLMQFNVDDNLTLKPEMYRDELFNKPNVGFTINYQF